MNKKEYLKKLENELSDLRYQDRIEVVNDYRDYFDNEREGGLTDEEIIQKLGSPKYVALQYFDNRDDYEKARERKRPTIKMSHRIITFIILFIPMMLLLITCLSLAIGMVSIGIALIVGPVAASIISFTTFSSVALIVATIIASIGLLLVGLAVTYYAFVGAINIGKGLLRILFSVRRKGAF